MEFHYCWKCKKEVPMLDEEEWAEIASLLTQQAINIKDYRQEYGVDIPTAQKGAELPATDKYFEITGYLETRYDRIRHHRLSRFGVPCQHCGHLLRSPDANFCANCGEKK